MVTRYVHVLYQISRVRESQKREIFDKWQRRSPPDDLHSHRKVPAQPHGERAETSGLFMKMGAKLGGWSAYPYLGQGQNVFLIHKQQMFEKP